MLLRLLLSLTKDWRIEAQDIDDYGAIVKCTELYLFCKEDGECVANEDGFDLRIFFLYYIEFSCEFQILWFCREIEGNWAWRLTIVG